MFSKDEINIYRFSKLNILNSFPVINDKELNRIVRAYIGIHSARIGKPFISLFNKGADEHIEKLYKRINQNDVFIQRRCMRKTLHICHINDLEMIHYATLKIRLPSERNLEKRIIESSQQSIYELLEGGGATADELYTHIAKTCKVNMEISKQLFKYHYENGLIYFKNLSLTPYSEKRIYYLLNINEINLTEKKDEQKHINELVARYIKNFGPVSFSDICWWSGLSQGKIKRSLECIEDKIELLEIQNPNCKMFVFKSEIENIKKIYNENESEIWCKFMSFEDSALKAYYETRFLYANNHSMFFNKIGEIYATILLNGKCVGIWELDLSKRKINILSLECNASQRDIVNKEKRRMEELLF